MAAYSDNMHEFHICRQTACTATHDHYTLYVFTTGARPHAAVSITTTTTTTTTTTRGLKFLHWKYAYK